MSQFLKFLIMQKVYNAFCMNFNTHWYITIFSWQYNEQKMVNDASIIYKDSPLLHSVILSTLNRIPTRGEERKW